MSATLSTEYTATEIGLKPDEVIFELELSDGTILEIDITGLDAETVSALKRITIEDLSSLFAVVMAKAQIDIMLRRQAASSKQEEFRLDRSNKITTKIEVAKQEADTKISADVGNMVLFGIVGIGVGLLMVVAGTLLALATPAIFAFCPPLGIAAGILAGVLIVGGVAMIVSTIVLLCVEVDHINQANNPELSEEDRQWHEGCAKHFLEKETFGLIPEDFFVLHTPDQKALLDYDNVQKVLNNSASGNNSSIQSIMELIKQITETLKQYGLIYNNITIERFKVISVKQG